MISTHFKMPYALFLNEKYSKLTNNEKLIYSVLYSRYEISCGNPDFRDGEGIYCIYTVEKLGLWLKMSKPTIVNGLKHLEEHGLIKRIKQARGDADKIYVKEAEVEHTITIAKYSVCKEFENLEKYANDTEIQRLQKVLDTLAFSNSRDFYKINGEYIDKKVILQMILSLDTGDVAKVFEKVRNTPKIKNKFFYLMTALYNYAVENC